MGTSTPPPAGMNQFITFMMSYLYLPIEIITRIQGI
jgi:hypothetical protein